MSTQVERRMPGEVGVWMFVFGDLALFGLFFGVYIQYRAMDPVTFSQSQDLLNVAYGAINTFFLLTSSWCVAVCVKAARANEIEQAQNFLKAGFAFGLGFLVVKLVEYSEKISAGYWLDTNDFFMYYFAYTGIHFVHFIVGMLVLIFLMFRANAGFKGKDDVVLLESGATYWHMVDLLWIVLFPLLYLI